MKHPVTILATSDLSEESEPALRRAFSLARQHEARLVLLHVIESCPEEVFLERDRAKEDMVSRLIAEAEAGLQRQAEKFADTPIRFRCQVKTGKDFVTIIQHARHLAADLIVLSAYGSHSLKDRFLGTTPGKVVRKGEIPVLTVKKGFARPYETILCAVDFSPASRQAFLASLALAPHAQFHLLHVYELWGEGQLFFAGDGEQTLLRYQQAAIEQAEKNMDAFLEGIEVDPWKVERHYRQGHPSTLISVLAEELGADLVTTGTEGRSGLPYILLGSVAEQVLHQAPCDVLTARPPDFRFELP